METTTPVLTASASSSRTSESATSADDAERILRDAAEQAHRNAERHAAHGPSPLAIGPIDWPARLRAKAEEVKATERDTPPVDDAVDQKRLREIAEACCKESQVPERYAGATPFDLTLLPPAEVGAYSQKIDRLREKLVGSCIVGLVGPRGTGKTWMACAMVNHFCRHGRRARYCDAMDYFLQLKATYGDRAKEDQTAVEARYLAPLLLVLDEMHERGDTPWEDRMLTRLVNKRYANGRMTVLVSNDDVDKFTARVGQSIADRMNDDGGLILCQWDSLRGRIAS